MSVDRENYLEKHWRAYPSAEFPGEIAYGRLAEISSSVITLQSGLSFSLSASVDFPTSVLRKDDWLGLRIENQSVCEIHLLAPALESPKKPQMSLEMRRHWAQYLQVLRDFFDGKNFLEVQTPTLVTCPGTEPFLDLFSTEFKQGPYLRKLYLPTSPEIHLKKLLAQGLRQIYEIRPCFRNGETSDRHSPEFLMCEWYRSFENLSQIQQDCLHLIDYAIEKLPTSLVSPERKAQVQKELQSVQRVSMAELFQKHLQFQLTPQTSIVELKKLAQRLELKAEKFEQWDDVFFLIFIEKIEPFLETDKPLFLEKYPPSQAALARLTADGWGDRFELYWKGLELANAFHELNDPVLQAQRFAEDLEKKRQLGKEVPPLDPEFMQALRSGMPPSSGIALGVERLFMALTGISDISHVNASQNFKI